MTARYDYGDLWQYEEKSFEERTLPSQSDDDESQEVVF